MLKKKIIALGLLTSLSLGLVACGNVRNETNTENKESEIVTDLGEVSDTIVDAVTDEVDDVIESTEDLVVEENDENIASTEVENEEINTEDIVEEIEMNVDAQIDLVFNSVKEVLGEDYYPNMSITPDILEGIYGLTSDMYESYYGEMPMISANVDFLLGVKAKEGMVDKVSETLNTYVEGLKEDTMQYPINKASLPAATVITKGDYVFAIATFGNTMEVAEDGDEAILEYVTENVNKTIETIEKAFVIE